ncbi:uncharacterized protein LOC131659896 [Vicia villosa]|uniref:uncharacterized protein LOC131659896 n=1 Tax=Vicia villosa TaxID=3911 RepID=UPI00273B06EC|nr:uncharacterized protein LOC131659896 [Vicia villosa]
MRRFSREIYYFKILKNVSRNQNNSFQQTEALLINQNMPHQKGDDVEHLREENIMKDVEDDMDIQSINREKYYFDYDEDDFSNRKLLDTTAAQAKKGKDIQGISWDKINVTREIYRQTRLERYNNYENIPHSEDILGMVTKKGYSFYEFRRNSRSVKPTILHFQLRNLVWATSKNDAYFTSNFSVMHWSSLTCTTSEVLNVSGHVAPFKNHFGGVSEGLTQTKVTTLAVKDNLLILGGFQGELICKHLDQPGVSFCTRTSYDENAVINAIEIYASPR